MELIKVTPPDVNGEDVSWGLEEVGNGLVIAPVGVSDLVAGRLAMFAHGDFDFIKALREPGVKDIGIQDGGVQGEPGSQSIGPEVAGNSDIVMRFFTDRPQHDPTRVNETYFSWLASNISLAKALRDYPGYVSTDDGHIGEGLNILVESVDFLGSSMLRLDNGLVTTLTMMSRAPGERVREFLESEDEPALSKEVFFGIKGNIFMDTVAACVGDSVYRIFPRLMGSLCVDPHARNVIVDPRARRISVLDANGIVLPLSHFMGRGNSLADLEIPANA